MTDYVLALIPQYGLLVVFLVITVACLGIPLPSSMIAIASGGFAATGDLTLWHVVVVTLLSFIFGDQLAFAIARYGGPKLITKAKGHKWLASLIGKGENLLEKRGNSAIILSRTVASPAGPWVSYICGATGFKWQGFAISATIGAIGWTMGYVFLGYFFAGQLSSIADIATNIIGILIAVVGVALSFMWLRKAWKNR